MQLYPQVQHKLTTWLCRINSQLYHFYSRCFGKKAAEYDHGGSSIGTVKTYRPPGVLGSKIKATNTGHSYPPGDMHWHHGKLTDSSG